MDHTAGPTPRQLLYVDIASPVKQPAPLVGHHGPDVELPAAELEDDASGPLVDHVALRFVARVKAVPTSTVKAARRLPPRPRRAEALAIAPTIETLRPGGRLGLGWNNSLQELPDELFAHVANVLRLLAVALTLELLLDRGVSCLLRYGNGYGLGFPSTTT
jgi:hypothetical protein